MHTSRMPLVIAAMVAATGLAGGTTIVRHTTLHGATGMAAAPVHLHTPPVSIALNGKLAAQQLISAIQTAGTDISAAQETFAASPRALSDWRVVGNNAAASYLDLLHSITRIVWPGRTPTAHVNAVVDDAGAMRRLLVAVGGASSITEAQGYSLRANMIVQRMRDDLDTLKTDLSRASA